MNCQLCNQQCLDNKNNVCSKCSTSGQEYNNMEEIMTDMFGEGGKEEVKEAFATPKEPEWKEEGISERRSKIKKVINEANKYSVIPMSEDIIIHLTDNLMGVFNHSIQTLLQSRDREWETRIKDSLILIESGELEDDEGVALKLAHNQALKSLLKPTK